MPVPATWFFSAGAQTKRFLDCFRLQGRVTSQRRLPHFKYTHARRDNTMMRHFFAGIAVLGAAVLQAAHADAPDKEQIQQAVNRGVLHLRELQAADGTWPAHPAGATALVGLTLLECDVPATDPAVQKAANYLRQAWTDINDRHTTYALSLTILFFDRLGDPADIPIIQALAVRLLGGQNTKGGWSYTCPSFGPEDVRRLKKLVERQVELKTQSGPPKPAPSPGDKPALPREIRQLLTRMEQKGPAPPGRLDAMVGGGGDNSNTQFAILGLWTARRQGIPVEKALARTATRFRSTQHADGGWGYMATLGRMPKFGATTPSMTCAGLLGLALGYGSDREAMLHTAPGLKSAKAASSKAPPGPTKDPVLRAGFTALARVIGRPLEDAGPGGVAAGLGDMYYLLWSVERVAVAYGLPTIGNKDWYAWGAALLLAAQRADGGWRGKFGTDVDTSFALLFLRRANLSPDLTAYLKGLEPETVALKTGGVLGERGATPGNDKSAKAEGEKEAKVRRDQPARPGGEKSTKSHADKDAKASKGEAVKAGGAQGAQPRAGANAEAGNDRVAKGAPAPAAPAATNAKAEAARLSAALLKASGPQQDQVLDQLKQAKGVAYTEALAEAIRELSGAVKTKARDALVERLARMTAATLRDKLQDETAEIRRAAALACAMKADKKFIPDLINLLEDQQPTVARAAHAALKDLTGQDFGPAANAPPAARSRAVVAWKEWWEKEGK
jgi:hypothetical protein